MRAAVCKKVNVVSWERFSLAQINRLTALINLTVAQIHSKYATDI